jgi:hypothetical protein
VQQLVRGNETVRMVDLKEKSVKGKLQKLRGLHDLGSPYDRNSERNENGFGNSGPMPTSPNPFLRFRIQCLLPAATAEKPRSNPDPGGTQ